MTGRGFGEAVSCSAAIPRREFVERSARAGMLLCFGIRFGAVDVWSTAPTAAPSFAPNQWLSIDEQGVITVRAHKSEMGQGVRTSLPAILIAELAGDWTKLRIVHAEPGPDFPAMGTSGSGSVEDSWIPLRRAAATARMLLSQAAANRWNVSVSECHAQNGEVTHAPTRRVATFGSLVADAARLPVPAKPELRPDRELTLLGDRLRRTDAHDIVRGSAVYGLDVRVPDMRFAVLARPPVAGATPAGFDESAARAVPGVERVIRTASGIAVVASNSWSAIRGREALSVRWSDADRGLASTRDLIGALENALDNGKVSRREGDVGRAMTSSVRTLEATYRMPFQAHAAMEPLSCVVDARPNEAAIWLGTQRPNGVKKLAADILGLPEDRVTVHVTLIGGAFGRRIPTDHAREAIELARAIELPVQVLWTREDDFLHDFYQAPQVHQVLAALGANGEIVAWRQQVAHYHLSMLGRLDPKADPASEGEPWGVFDSPYVFPSYEASLARLESPVQTGAWRSVFYPGGVFARESFIDELAHAMNRDPLALRLELLARTPNQPASRNAQRTSTRLRRVLQQVADRAQWATRRSGPRDGRRWGMGLACNPYFGGAMVAQVAEVSVGASNDIRVHRVITAIDVGRVVDRSGLEAQVQGGVAWALSAALKTQITFANGRAEQTNFDRFPVLRMREMPAQEIVIVENELPPFGAGEPPVPAVYAAVANAVFAATGQRILETPIVLRG